MLTELSLSTRYRVALVPRASDLWPALIGPLVVAFVYLGLAQGWEWVRWKALHEVVALVLTSVAFAIFAWTAYRTGDPLQWVFTGLSATFVMREIHFYGSDDLMLAALAAIAIWAWHWRERLLEPMQRAGTRRWLYSTLIVYFVSQLMDRRGMRFLPDEETIHVPAEEMLENAGHILWIAAAVVTRRATRLRARRAQG